ncbi:MAG: hypothetical protein U1E10_11370, partial [Bdellovibrionales bacterium]|nr:hypothetical protein [Bdellovibrionales bacterium]
AFAATPADCAPDFARLHVAHPRTQASLKALKRDLPEINDPVQLVLDFAERRRKWNLDFPEGHPKRNNFPAPELRHGVKEVRALLTQIKRPPENRVAAEKLLREIKQAEAEGLPYRDTYRKIEAATYLLQLKFRSPVEKAEAISLSTRFARVLPMELQQTMGELIKKHRVGGVVPEYDLRSQAELDKFDTNAAAYFKEMNVILDDFFKTAGGQEVRNSLLSRRQKLDQVTTVGSFAARQLESEKIELDRFLKVFADSERKGIQRFITRPTITANPTHPIGVPVIDESLFESEILLPTSRDLHIEGLAESFMIGLTPVQIISRPRRADGLWMDSYLFANHDGFHRFLAAQESQVNLEIIQLPIQERLQILAEIDSLPSPERRSLAQTALYLTVHENGSNSTLPINTPAAAAHTRDEFRRLADRTLSNEDLRWVRNWYQQTVQRRVDHFRRSSPP